MIRQSFKRLVLIGTLATLIVLMGLLYWSTQPDIETMSNPNSKNPLYVYCAAGIKPPVEEVAREYTNQYKIPIRLEYGGSGTLLSKLRLAKQGDIYIAGDSSFIRIARERGLVAEALPLAHLRPVIAVAKGNPKQIHGVEDLLRDEVRVALGNPEAASVGKQTRLAMMKKGLWERLEKHVQERGVFKPTVNELANDIKIGTVDAAVVWDATARQYDELEIVTDLTEDPSFIKSVTLGILNTTKQPTQALRFARYLAARDKGLLKFREHHYTPIDGDVWAEVPEIRLLSGGVNRPAIENTIKAFEAREGCIVNRAYNGCGILVAQMKAGQRPDAYFSCDVSFMKQVQDLFLDAVNVSETDIIIALPKGNPKQITSLQDLTKQKLKIGVANPQQSALGALTERMLKSVHLWQAIQPNIAAQTPTADLLVNQLRSGALDAAIVYEANISQVREHVDIVRIDLPTAKAVQPYAVAKHSDHRYLVQRLFEAITSNESQQKYQQSGFRFLYSTEQP